MNKIKKFFGFSKTRQEIKFQDFIKQVAGDSVWYYAIDYKNDYTLSVRKGSYFGGALKWEITTSCVENSKRGVEIDLQEFLANYNIALDYFKTLDIKQSK